ncbi:patatin-like phospholipase family protein [Herbiconiux sp. CPCC 205763]|uniref:Patatin-like phospholipase family protein n=1 Tax=Herbiconiux aconitum TaxID=2970913 RepID=A0ABT2GRW7_9MICO|nr:patatin-like phospholipase family protein [Herbiconiux aconitum]MCS5717679.1 patatin-like phospholipase family protein [Herbiconiux aconitum]
MSESTTTRALVLGGGGITGIGWEVGVLAGLLDEGVDLRNADTVIGTSAGSFVGTNFSSGADWDEIFAAQARAVDHEPTMKTDPAVFQAWQEAFRSGQGDAAKIGAAFGEIARRFPSPVPTEVRKDAVRSRLRADRWPETMRVTITDAVTGEIKLLGPGDGVNIETATAASGAVPGIWPSVVIAKREYVDAGMVSAANASLAAGHDVVVVLAPMPAGYAGIPSAQDDVDRLNETATALLASPDEQSRDAIGSNPYDPTRASAAAAAGRQQGRALAAQIRDIW